jgi:CBS domain containing-hemolysin-like protein
MGEPFVAPLLEPVFFSLGITQPALVSTIAFAVGFSIITFLHIVFGELAPKSLAIQRASRVTLSIATPLHWFFLVFRPFIWALNSTANYFLRLAGIQPASEGEIAHSEEELRLLLSKGTTLTSTSKNISLRAIELRERTVREVMVPRTGLVYLSTLKSLEENIAIALENQFTRYPLCERNLDNIIGMIHLKDLFKLKGDSGAGTRLNEIKREMLFVPETMSLERTLNMFLAKRVLMAIAVDEYGGTAGLVTLENVLEELVGEIRDEFDVESVLVQKVTDTEFLVDGGMPLLDFSRMFEVVPDSRDVVTVSGYVIHLLGLVPERGTRLSIGLWDATVEAVDGIESEDPPRFGNSMWERKNWIESENGACASVTLTFVMIMLAVLSPSLSMSRAGLPAASALRQWEFCTGIGHRVRERGAGSLVMRFKAYMPIVSFHQGPFEIGIGYTRFTLQGSTRSSVYAGTVLTNEIPVTTTRVHALVVPICVSADFTKTESAGVERDNFNVASLGIGSGLRYRYAGTGIDASLRLLGIVHYSFEGLSTGSGSSFAVQADAGLVLRSVHIADGLALGYRLRYQQWSMSDARFDYRMLHHGPYLGVLF